MRLPLLSALLYLACALGQSVAQDYPARPIRFWVPSSPGGGADVIARVLAARLAGHFHEPVLVENRVASGGALATTQLMKVAPDGYTLMVTFETFAINPLVFPSLAYDPVRDFTLLSVLARYDLMLFAHAGRGFGNLQGFLDHARRFPDRVNFASPGPAGPARLAFESLKELAGAGGTPVHFKGLGPALTALLGGELDAGFAQANQAVRGGVNAGRLVVLGTGGVRRSSRFPDVPAIAELLPGFEAASWVGMIGPPGMSPVVVERIASALRLSLDNADFRAQLGDQGGELVLAGPDAFSALIARDVARLGPVVRRLGIRAE